MASGPEFVLYVSAVKGSLVPRYGSSGHFGVSRGSGDEPFIWDEDRVFPITAEMNARYGRELRSSIVLGSLKERKAEEFEAQFKAESDAEKAAIEAAEKLAREAAEKAQSQTSNDEVRKKR